MYLNTLKPTLGAKKQRVRVGRGIGSGLGKTAGRGHKGQYARTGKGKVKPGFEGGQMPLQRRLPKVGFRLTHSNECAEVMLYQLNALKSDIVSFALLKEWGLIEANSKSAKVVKKGDITRPLRLQGLAVTGGTKKAIEALGGSVE